MIQTDILIIGAGITGTALARELSRYHVSVTVIERGADVAEGATKANSGIVHAGYDAVPGSLKAYYNVLGASMYPGLCRELGIPYRQKNDGGRKIAAEPCFRRRRGGRRYLELLS